MKQIKQRILNNLQENLMDGTILILIAVGLVIAAGIS